MHDVYCHDATYSLTTSSLTCLQLLTQASRQLEYYTLHLLTAVKCCTGSCRGLYAML